MDKFLSGLGKTIAFIIAIAFALGIMLLQGWVLSLCLGVLGITLSVLQCTALIWILKVLVSIFKER